MSINAFWVWFLLLCSLQPWLRCEGHAGEVLSPEVHSVLAGHAQNNIKAV